MFGIRAPLRRGLNTAQAGGLRVLKARMSQYSAYRLMPAFAILRVKVGIAKQDNRTLPPFQNILPKPDFRSIAQPVAILWAIKYGRPRRKREQSRSAI